MDFRVVVAASVLAFSLTGCATQEGTAEDDGTWVGTITTEGDVTAVVNESGSVWGGVATLEEEASIGVDVGEDEYMFGRPATVTANAESIVVIDSQAVVVRIYDHAGRFQGNRGSSGQGPGEYALPRVARIDRDGRVFVLDAELGRVTVYAADGSPTDTWPIPLRRTPCCAWSMFPRDPNSVWLPAEEVDVETRIARYGVQAHGTDGPIGEVMWVPDIGLERPTFEFNGRQVSVPLTPRLVWGGTPSGGVFVAAGDRYRFEVRERNGSTLIIERNQEPEPYPAEEIEWNRRRQIASLQAQQPGWTWDGAEIPAIKPLIRNIVPVASGGFWVSRDGASIKVADCTEYPVDPGATSRFVPCWEAEVMIDAFDEEGRFLGQVETPDLISPVPLLLHVDGDAVVTGGLDEQGIYRVKRYRLVLPGEEGQ